MGLYFEDFYPGLSWRTASRKVTRDDINAFCDLFGDRNLLHVDEGYAQSKGYPTVIAHGPFGISLVTGLSSQLGMINDTNIGVLDLRWTFRKAIAAGDTIHVEMEITECRPTSKPNRGIVVREYRAVNQNGEVVQVGWLTLLVQARGGAPKEIKAGDAA